MKSHLLPKENLVSPMESHGAHKPHPRAGPMTTSRWPTKWSQWCLCRLSVSCRFVRAFSCLLLFCLCFYGFCFVYMCVSCAFSLFFIFFLLFCLPVCIFPKEREKARSLMGGRGGSGRSWGSGTVLRIFCMKKIFSVKINKDKWRHLGPTTTKVNK